MKDVTVFRTRMLGGGPEDPMESVNTDCTMLAQRFADSHLAMYKVHTPAGILGWEMPDEIELELAHAAEIVCCLATVNFVRWLCGLPLLQANATRLKLCDMISQVLVQRDRAHLEGRTAEALELADLFKRVLNMGGPVAILHLEASLVSAVDRSLSATHLVAAPQQLPRGMRHAPTRREIAEALATRVEMERRVEPSIGKAKQFGTDPAPPMLKLEELPAALEGLRALWELRPRGAGGGAASHAQGTADGGEPSRQNLRPEVEVHAAVAPRRQALVRSVAQPLSAGPPCGLSAIWGDRHGALSFRRALLQPALREFGAARRQDTCVLWTGASSVLDFADELEALRRSVPVQLQRPDVVGNAKEPSDETPQETWRIESVSYPPAGLVPIALLEGGQCPWTIMPDSTRFQPTATTNVRAWRVEIRRPPLKEWSAERISELVIHGCAVDCSAHGEPFCVVFWPQMEQLTSGLQLEVELSGLRGMRQKISHFYELQHFVSGDVDACLCHEAERLRKLFGARDLWSEPREVPVAAERPAENAVDLGAPGRPQLARTSGRHVKLAASKAAPDIQTVSHHSLTIHTNSVDLAITLRSEDISCLESELTIARASADEVVPRGSQVLRLKDGYFLVRLKLPMPRCRFELTFRAGTLEAPHELHIHRLKYTIQTGHCSTLMTTMKDINLPKYGFPILTPAAQVLGITVLAPSTHRVHPGQCYFLVHVDLPMAIAAFKKHGVSKKNAAGKEVGRAAPTYSQEPSDGHALAHGQSTLFPARLRHRKTATKDGAPPGGGGVDEQRPSYLELLRVPFERYCQDSDGELHLNVSMHNGECVHRLKERQDLSGLYEGLIAVSDSNANTTITLTVRFPRLHASEYCPGLLAWWHVFRQGHLPMNF